MAEIVLISFSVEIDMENKEWQIKITENALTIGKINRVSSSKFRLSKWRPPCRPATSVAHERNEFQFPEPSLQTEIAFSLQHQEN